MFAESIRNNLLLNLVSEWKFDDSSNLGIDSWGDNNGTNHGADLVSTDCISGGCASFISSNNDYIDCGNGASLNITGAITIEAWVKPNSALPIEQAIIANNNSSSVGYWVVYNRYSNKKLGFFGVNNTMASSDGNIEPNEWTHVVVTREGTDITFYINGDFDIIRPIGGTVNPASNESFIIGKRSDGNYWYFSGQIDEVQIYDTAISEAQIKQLIEILVVIVIIGILSSFIFFTINDSVEKANIAKSKMFAESIRNNFLLNLVSEWKFDNSSDLGIDSWGSNNGTNYGADSVSTDCVSGGCASFISSNSDYVDCGNDASTQISGSITVGMWLYKKIADHNNIPISRGPYNTAGSWYFHTSDAGSSFLRIKDISYSAPTIPNNEWTHLVWTHNGGDGNGILNFYKNGSFDRGATNAIAISGTPTLNLLIGKYHNAGYEFNGSIDEVQIYNTAIPASQIKQNYLAGLNNLYAKGMISETEYNEKLSQK